MLEYPNCILPIGKWNWHPYGTYHYGDLTLWLDGSLTTGWGTHKGGYWEITPEGLVKLAFRAGGTESLMSYTEELMTKTNPKSGAYSTATWAGPLDQPFEVSPVGVWDWWPIGDGEYGKKYGELTLHEDGSLTNLWADHNGGYWEIMPNGLVKMAFRQGG